jgi:hypothetical protein
MLLSITNKKLKIMPKEIKTIKFMNFPMDKLSPLAAKDSDAQKLFSSQC